MDLQQWISWSSGDGSERHSGSTNKTSGSGGTGITENLYKLCYLTGGYASLYFKRAVRSAKKMLAPTVRFGEVLYERIIVERWMNLKSEWKDVRADFSVVSERMSTAHGFKEKCIELFKLAVDGVTKHSSLTKKALNVGAPAVALLILFLTVNHYANLDFALSVSYNGEELGFVANEGVYTSANDMVNERIVSSGAITLESSPTYTLAVADSNTDFSSDNDICDSILGLANGEIEEAYGLLVNGELIGAIDSQGDMTYILETYLDSFKMGLTNEKAEFTDLVEVVYGYYPVSSIIDAEELDAILNKTYEGTEYYTVVYGDTPYGIAGKFGMTLAQLKELNENLDELMYPNRRVKVSVETPLIGVKSVAKTTYSRSIAYGSKTVKDSTKYTTYKKLQTAGVKGVEKITEQKVYINGILTDTTVVEKTVTKKPVDEVYVVGTKKKPSPGGNKGSSSSSGSSSGSSGGSSHSVSSGRFTWPVPGYRTVSSYYGSRWGRMHKGIDISRAGIKGASIVASASGTVIKAKSSSTGYGKHIIIDHGNGFTTLYGHCSQLLVSVGDRVSKGQVIAKVGNTGNSTGAHLHFEIRVNGSQRNPLNYL